MISSRAFEEGHGRSDLLRISIVSVRLTIKEEVEGKDPSSKFVSLDTIEGFWILDLDVLFDYHFLHNSVLRHHCGKTSQS